ncbi:MAG: hypothetical protein ACI9Y1_001454 [Lentisphaeria bacterium]|jgi:hypothetical protein
MKHSFGFTSCLALAGLLCAPLTAFSAPTSEQMWEIIQKQQAEIEQLKQEQQNTSNAVAETDKKVEATADVLESTGATAVSSKKLEWAEKTKIGGYAEIHYNNFDNADNEIDAHRFVFFMGHEFSDSVRMFSEFELEHSIAADGKKGEVELEQAYIEWSYANKHALVAGLYLVPVGILNETHEPNTFYGVERNLVEKKIIPVTWWESGLMFKGELAPGLSYDVALHSGLSGSVLNESEEYDLSIRSGRQKSSEATANDLAYTGRIKYTGIAGLELAATVQYQEDITQGLGIGSEVSDTASPATLLETHVIYHAGMFGVRALYTSWNVSGDYAKSISRDEQTGWYVEPTIKPFEKIGFFARYSEWDNSVGGADSKNQVVDIGFNYWLTPEVVFKADYQDASDYNDNNSYNLGVGWSF